MIHSEFKYFAVRSPRVLNFIHY